VIALDNVKVIQQFADTRRTQQYPTISSACAALAGVSRGVSMQIPPMLMRSEFEGPLSGLIFGACEVVESGTRLVGNDASMVIANDETIRSVSLSGVFRVYIEYDEVVLDGS
jgi:hypothetical protein